MWFMFYLGTVSLEYSSCMKGFQHLVKQTSQCSHTDSIAHFPSPSKADSLGSTTGIDSLSKTMSR